MHKIIFDDTACGESMYALNLTEEQIRFLEWLRKEGFLEDVRIIGLDDENCFEKI